ncbi:MAG: 50S ribosomal protein L4 [Thermoproteota archaeon]|nr:50S ribosomal protein L4 [Thermoproteota archaeon]
MNTKVFDLQGNELSTMELPPVFNFPYRPEVIKKVYVNLDSHHYQKQGRYPAAGEIVSAESRNTGLGIARLARAKGEGFSRAGQAAGVAGVRKGRLAHPPESWKIIYKKINKKEKMIALYSSISSTAVGDLAKKRGHIINNVKAFPLVISNDIENIQKTKELYQVLKALGVEDDLNRVENSIKKRTGKSRRRGRSNRIGKSAIIIIGTQDAHLLKLNDSLPGITIKYVKNLSVLDFAPGSKPIRLAIFSQSAIDRLNEIKLPANMLLEK